MELKLKLIGEMDGEPITRKETVEEARARILKEEEGFTCKLCEDTGTIEDEDGFVRKCKVCADTGEGHYSQDKE